MRLDGVPNDAIKAINPVFCIILGPLLQRFLYPGLRKAGIRFGPIARMTWAFVTMSGSMAFAAGVQKLVYSRGPCYEKPLVCEASDGGRIGNDISVWVQIPIFFFLGLAEILGFTTLAEYSYSEAPTNMRTLVQFLGTGELRHRFCPWHGSVSTFQGSKSPISLHGIGSDNGRGGVRLLGGLSQIRQKSELK